MGGEKMEKVEKVVVFGSDFYTFIIKKKDNSLFENARENCRINIHHLIEGLQLNQVEYEFYKWEVRK